MCGVVWTYDIISRAFLSPNTLSVEEWKWHRLQIQGYGSKAQSSDMAQELQGQGNLEIMSQCPRFLAY